MKRRFTVVMVVEQDASEEAVMIDAEALEIQVRASVEETDTYSVGVRAVAIVTERWDPETSVYVVE